DRHRPRSPASRPPSGHRSRRGSRGGVVTEPRYHRRADVLWRRSLDAVVLLPKDAAEPLTLAGTGPDLWELLADTRAEAEVVEALAARYRADSGTVANDVHLALAALLAVRAVAEAPANGAGSEPG